MGVKHFDILNEDSIFWTVGVAAGSNRSDTVSGKVCQCAKYLWHTGISPTTSEMTEGTSVVSYSF
jgi:hypothetical protein